MFKEQTDDDYWDPATNGQTFKTEKFPCEICGKSFSRMDKLKEHTKVVHEGIREHKCETCGKEFGRANQLQASFDLVTVDLKIGQILSSDIIPISYLHMYIYLAFKHI